jgi:hypothetical protein
MRKVFLFLLIFLLGIWGAFYCGTKQRVPTVRSSEKLLHPAPDGGELSSQDLEIETVEPEIEEEMPEEGEGIVEPSGGYD